jgi:hypothetical protein
MKKIFKKGLIVGLCCSMLMTMPVSAMSDNNFELTPKVFTESGLMEKGANNIFKLNENADLSVQTAVYGETSVKPQKNDIEYKIDIVDNDDNSASVTLEGTFYVNGVQADFTASDDMVKKTTINGKETLYIGALSGTCTIDKIERDITVSFEKTKKNLYLAIAINTLGSEEGIALIQFGNSILTNDIYNDIFKNKDNDPIVTPMVNYDYEDSDWREILDNETSYTVIKGELYVEESLVNGDTDGRILANFLYDSNALLKELNVSQSDYRFEDIECVELYANYESRDQEAYFGGHHPDENQSSYSAANWVANALYDIGLPSYGLSTLTSLISASQDDIVVYNDSDLYERGFRIDLSGEDYMDWYEDRDGGYCVEVAVHATNSSDDDIWVTGEMELGFRMFDDYTNAYIGWATLGTQQVVLHVDLADYK